MTMEELVALLSKDTRIDLCQFGKNGTRTLSTLLDQVNKKDLRIAYDQRTSEVVIFRSSVWGVLETEDRFTLVEVARWRPIAKERFLWIFKRWRWIKVPVQFGVNYGISITETLKSGEESPEDALARGIYEEWWIKIPEAVFKPKYVRQEMHPRRPSTVYPRLWTDVFSSTYKFTVRKRLSIWDPVAIDPEESGPVLIFLEWLPMDGQEKRHQELLRKILSPLIKKAAIIWCHIRY